MDQDNEPKIELPRSTVQALKNSIEITNRLAATVRNLNESLEKIMEKKDQVDDIAFTLVQYSSLLESREANK